LEAQVVRLFVSRLFGSFILALDTPLTRCPILESARDPQGLTIR
jgi:hypothetical protein